LSGSFVQLQKLGLGIISREGYTPLRALGKSETQNSQPEHTDGDSDGETWVLVASTVASGEYLLFPTGGIFQPQFCQGETMVLD